MTFPVVPHSSRGALMLPDLERTLRFAAALTRLAARSPQVHQLTVEVQHLLKPRSAYRRPWMMARLLMEMARDGRARGGVPRAVPRS